MRWKLGKGWFHSALLQLAFLCVFRIFKSIFSCYLFLVIRFLIAIMPRAPAVGEAFQWTDDEVCLLLSVAIEYKTQRTIESVDWESVWTKYADSLALLKEKLPETAEETRNRPDMKDLPHTR
eukprot:scpid107322/ scgid16987/ 